MENENEIIEQAVIGGLIGAGLGLLISNNKTNVGLAALAGSVLLATLKANEKAIKSNVPVLVEEKGVIYEMNSKGEKKFIKRIEKLPYKIQPRFKLK